jgi:hypothetical protein
MRDECRVAAVFIVYNAHMHWQTHKSQVCTHGLARLLVCNQDSFCTAGVPVPGQGGGAHDDDPHIMPHIARAGDVRSAQWGESPQWPVPQMVAGVTRYLVPKKGACL